MMVLRCVGIYIYRSLSCLLTSLASQETKALESKINRGESHYLDVLAWEQFKNPSVVVSDD